ncbi:MAG: prepilin-type N-terminal cleavage/methylation domain-containing protein [Lacunisphaera sp.]|nr:prepilin-type N-terminal cleavage/methylation domain-containing protein [Lacunisphaera sp.]
MKRPGFTLRAFTLIEVLISLAIFALAAVVLAAAYLNVLGGYQAVARRQQGEEDWKLVRAAVLSESDRTVLESGGRLPLADGSNLRWTVKIEGTAIADLFVVNVRAEPELSVTGESWARAQKLLLLRPGWSDPAERDKLRAATQQRFVQQRR